MPAKGQEGVEMEAADNLRALGAGSTIAEWRGTLASHAEGVESTLGFSPDF